MSRHSSATSLWPTTVCRPRASPAHPEGGGRRLLWRRTKVPLIGLLWAALPAAVQAQGPDAGLLKNFNYTCLLPAAEDKGLNASAPGQLIQNLVFDVLAGLLPNGSKHCGDWDLVSQKCKDVQPGTFCVMKEDDEQNGTCVLQAAGVGPALSLPCIAGFQCPGGAAEPRTCRKGDFCPQGAVARQPCPEGSFCIISAEPIACNTSTDRRLEGAQCMPDSDGRTILPQPCAKGSFCEGGKPTPCSAGHYCPYGAAKETPCRFGEVCPPGRAKPFRIPAAIVYAVTSLAVLAFLTSSLDVWCLDRRLWWLRVSLVSAVVAGIWVEEIARKDKELPVITFLTATWIGVAWGLFASPRFRALFSGVQYGDLLANALDGAMYIGGAVGVSLVATDITAGLFLCSMFLAGLLLKEILVGDPWPIKLTLSVLGGSLAFMVVLLAYLENSWELLVFYPILVALVTIATLVKHRKPGCSIGRFWDMHSPAVPSVLGASTGATELEAGVASGMPRVSEAPSLQDPEGISIEFRNVSLTLPSGQVILDDVSLRIPAASSVAIMGPSGCGKSSITNVLSGRAGYGNVSGDIRINNSSRYTIAMLSRVTGFVPQDDVMHRNLTVEENVTFQAEMRMPRILEGQSFSQGRQAEAHVTFGTVGDDSSSSGSLRTPLSMSRQVRGRVVDEEVNVVLKRLGLGDPKLRRTLIGDEATRGVSGGQRKRVSIAMELVAKPSLLFLDEPTSGLDSTTSHSVVKMFTQAARDCSCTTLAVIHQPRYETLCLFSRVILLAPGGHLVFSGPVHHAKKYFEQVFEVKFPSYGNPADTFLDVMTLECAQRMVKDGDMAATVNTSTREAFGPGLALLWQQHSQRQDTSNGKSFEGLTSDDMRARLPALNFETGTWGDEVFVQVQRAMLQFKREWQAVLVNNALLVFGLLCLCLGSPGKLPTEDIMHPMLALMLLMLTQGVAAQRLFGGAERPVGWREAGSSVSAAFYFVGRDIAALADIVVGTLCFTMVYWPLSPLLVSYRMMFWITFAFVYVTWGMSYIWSITLPAGGAQMMAVVSAFTAQLLAGVQPPFRTIIDAGGGQGIYLMALSPIRWAHGLLLSLHMLSCDSQFSNALVQLMSIEKLTDIGMPVVQLKAGGFQCKTGGADSPFRVSTRRRWLGLDDLPPNSFVCTTKQLMLLGLFFRFVAAMCLLIISRQRVRGGGRLLDVDAADGEGKPGPATSLLRKLILVFFLAFAHLQMVLLLLTK